MAEDDDRRARAEARRARIVLRKTRLGDEVDLHPVRGGEAVALAARVSLAAWSMSGRPLPREPRGEVQVRFVRRSS